MRRNNRKPSLLEQLEIAHGPQSLLGHFFVKAVHAARERGVELRFAKFDELLAVNASNGKTWRPLDTTLHPVASKLDETNSFCIVGENEEGAIVATQVLRLFDWRGTNLKVEAEALRMFYADPAEAAPGEACKVTAPSAEHVTGLVSYAGGVWYRPDYRGGRLSTILPRIGRTISLARWNVDFVLGMMVDKTVAAGFAERSGFPKVEWEMVRTNAPVLKNDPAGLRLALMFMYADEMVDSVFNWLLQSDTEVDRAVGARRA